VSRYIYINKEYYGSEEVQKFYSLKLIPAKFPCSKQDPKCAVGGVRAPLTPGRADGDQTQLPAPDPDRAARDRPASDLSATLKPTSLWLGS
jgi:hypothetical protein